MEHGPVSLPGATGVIEPAEISSAADLVLNEFAMKKWAKFSEEMHLISMRTRRKYISKTEVRHQTVSYMN